MCRFLRPGCAADTTARAWDVNTGDEMTVFRGHDSSLRGLAMAEGVLYSCAWDNIAIGWDARTGAELARYPHPDGVLAVALLDDMLFTACWDGKARSFDIRTGDELQCFDHPDGVVALNIPEESGGMLFTAGWDGIARAWDARGGRQLLSDLCQELFDLFLLLFCAQDDQSVGGVVPGELGVGYTFSK